MLKFSLQIQPSRWGRSLQAALFAVLITSLWCWKPDVLPLQTLWQLLLSGLLVFAALQQRSARTKPCAVILSDEGHWHSLPDTADDETTTDQASLWQLGQDGLITRWCVWVQLVATINGRRKTRWELVFRDQLDEQHFRRLCRTMVRCRAQSTAE